MLYFLPKCAFLIAEIRVSTAKGNLCLFFSYFYRVSVVGNSVHWNSSHTFQCKVHVDPETHVLESCKLKISVRMVRFSLFFL